MASSDRTNDGEAHIPGTVHLVDLLGTMSVQHAEGGQRDIVLTPSRKALSAACMCVYTLMVRMLPMALQYGKRPIYLLSILATLGTQVWAPYTKTNGQWIANKIVQEFVAAPIESLCEISVTDIYFTHERGRYFGLYALLLAGSSFFAPIIAGNANTTQYWCAIFCGIGFVFLVFFMEETNYVRRHVAPSPPSSSRPTPNISPDEKPTAKSASPKSHPISEPTPTPSKSRKTYLQRLALYRPAHLEKPNELIGMATRPLIYLSFPVIFYAGFPYGTSLIWFNMLNATISLLLTSTYSFSPSIVGRAKNNGIMESEHRIWLFVPFDMILWGVSVAHHVHWFGPVFAMGVITMTTSIGLQISVAYCIDSYRALSGEAIVTVILVRNTMSFAIGYEITPWVTDMGVVCTIFIMIRYGKGLRELSVGKHGKYADVMAKSRMVHREGGQALFA
ncbi:hypothetical protein CC80DRAFT_520578 [Byssothecium circinans]|uniref:MFS general substrate transporter n=1 Tax=Byssothecium circinans TaxID=147558 RepID=A0A6A5T8R2_9PLEO|nr:hypothetical protein CC80DRAFT_520578 [Byssothecium circinans]